MTFLVVILGVLLALVSSGFSLYCTDCASMIGTSCTGQSVNCPPGYVCGATYMSTSEGGLNTTIYARSCVSENQCFKSGSASFLFGRKMKMVTSCCITNNCNPTLATFPTDNSVSNGLTCSSCVSVESPWCTVQCTGEENMCLLQSTYEERSQPVSTSYHGCTTKSICSLSNLCYSVNGISTDIGFTCTGASGAGLQTRFYLPSIICVLFLKLLFVM